MILGVQEGFNVKYTNKLEKLIEQFYNAIICEITMQAVSNNEDFKSYPKAQRNVQNLKQK